MSMTGFGKGRTVERDKSLIEVELKSVNHRFFELSPRLPSDLSYLEGRIVNHLRRRVARGKLFLTVILQRGSYKDLILNEPLAQRYYRLIKRLGEKMDLNNEIKIQQLLALPDLFIRRTEIIHSSRDWNRVKQTLDQALEQLLKTRQQEGKALEKELRHRIHRVEQAVDKIAKRTPQAIQEYQEALVQKMKALSEEQTLDSQRVQTEIALYVKNGDITEEIVRIRSHIAHFRESLLSHHEVGRKLDFIAQELQREANTIGSKVNDASTARWVILMKSEIDKIREQVQNVE